MIFMQFLGIVLGFVTVMLALQVGWRFWDEHGEAGPASGNLMDALARPQDVRQLHYRGTGNERPMLEALLTDGRRVCVADSVPDMAVALVQLQDAGVDTSGVPPLLERALAHLARAVYASTGKPV